MKAKKRKKKLLTKHGTERYDTRIQKIGDIDSVIKRVKRAGKDPTWFKGSFYDYLLNKASSNIKLIVYDDTIYVFDKNLSVVITVYKVPEKYIPIKQFLMSSAERTALYEPDTFIQQIKSQKTGYDKYWFKGEFYEYLSSLEIENAELLVVKDKAYLYEKGKPHPLTTINIPSKYLPINKYAITKNERDLIYFPQKFIKKVVRIYIRKDFIEAQVLKVERLSEFEVIYTIRELNKDPYTISSSNISSIILFNNPDSELNNYDIKKENYIKTVEMTIKKRKNNPEKLAEYCESEQKRLDTKLTNLISNTSVVNCVVEHNKLGIGTIIDQTEGYIKVKFANGKIVTFKYPNIFLNKHIKFEKEHHNQMIKRYSIVLEEKNALIKQIKGLNK